MMPMLDYAHGSLRTYYFPEHSARDLAEPFHSAPAGACSLDQTLAAGQVDEDFDDL
jgi:hypothetical protein